MLMRTLPIGNTMMATTHALVGVLLGSASLFVAPELAPIAVFAGLAGGVFPDFDLYSGHRKTAERC
jgi:hypothetical protein